MEKISHTYNRGVEKRTIFLDNNDYLRFVNGLYVFNDKHPALCTNTTLRKKSLLNNSSEVQPRRDPLVEVGAFILMPNHYHLLLREVAKNGIPLFMQKLGTGYTMYFNQKYDRVGSLFQGRYKSVEIEDDPQAHYIPHYIHANPIELVDKNWKDRKIKNLPKVLTFIKNYRWSSLSKFTNERSNEFDDILSNKLINDLSVENYQKDFRSWLKELNFSPIKDSLQ